MDSFQFFIPMYVIYTIGMHATGKGVFFNNQLKKRYQYFYSNDIARSYVDCVSLCTRADQCGAANFNTDTFVCQLSDFQDVNTQDALSVGEPWILTKKKKSIGAGCDEDQDCWETNSLCINNVCFCIGTTKYNATTSSCDIGCSQYAIGYMEIESKSITKYNIAGKENLTRDACELQCDDWGDICGSFDYNADVGRCLLNKITYQQALDADSTTIKDTRDGFVLFTKHC